MDSKEHALLPAQAGFSIHRHGPHGGGGTGNVVYRFRNALLELAYPIDPDEIAALGRIGFAARWRWRENGYAPFGVVFQLERRPDVNLPFETWEYVPPFMPEARWIVVQAPPQEPLYMLAPFAVEPRCDMDGPVMASIEIECPELGQASPAARFLAASRICHIAGGRRAMLRIVVAGRAAPTIDMRPEVPLVVLADAGQGVTDVARDGF